MTDARLLVVLPGLVNGHTHLLQTSLRGLADRRPLIRWLKEVIWPAQAADGSGPNNSHDLLECAKIGALLAKHATGDAQAVLPVGRMPPRRRCADAPSRDSSGGRTTNDERRLKTDHSP